MPHQIIMPQLGMAQDSGIIVAWRKAVGDAVQPDDIIMEVETDKAVMEVPAGVQGFVAEIRTGQGEEAAVGQTVAIVSETREVAISTRTSPSGSTAEKDDPKPPAPVRPSTPSLPALAPSPPAAVGKRVLASPKARRIARERGIDLGSLVRKGARQPVRSADLNNLPGSGLSDRSSLWDVDHGAWGPVNPAPVSRFHRIASERLTQTLNTVVPVTHHDQADMTEVEAARTRFRPEAEANGIHLTALSFHVRALATTLSRHPVFNASLSADETMLWMKGYFHVGIVVNTEHGIVIPVIRNADTKGLLAIAAEIQDFAERARDRKIRPDELGGASMSISSLGREGGTGFTPVINAPEAAILGISRMDIAPVWDGSVFQPRPMVPLDLTYDHRIVNGAEAASFMTDYRRHLECPALLLL